MKNVKLKVVLTNISRIITSFLFINLGSLIHSKYVNAASARMEPSCYLVGPTDSHYNNSVSEAGKQIIGTDNVFIILVPIAIIVIIVGIVIYKCKKNKKKEKAKEEINNDK